MRRGAVVLVSRVGAVNGSRAAAAALACAGSDHDRAGLLVELSDGRAPRPALIATVSARRLEERLAAHLPEAAVAARGHICHLALAADRGGLERVPAALALARETTGVVHLPPPLLRAALGKRSEPSAILLRVDLRRDHALAALAVRDLMERGLRVSVLKRPLAWVAARRALFGVLPPDSPDGLPRRLQARCLIEPAEPPASVDDGVAPADDLAAR
jgi:hypothetical protein